MRCECSRTIHNFAIGENTYGYSSVFHQQEGWGWENNTPFNMAWHCAYNANLRVLAVDLDPQVNLSQYVMGTKKYKEMLEDPEQKTVVDVFEQFSAPTQYIGSPTRIKPEDVICNVTD